ncbi:helix-turn-helix transcriptional regulator [Collinsella sp. BA40]|uniref:helix-turn-helix transcriptional regulator n=1 Tax=Collinsella sp. BA40 TaxID=2560852 RepID=UPI0011C76F34|nr:helix-turn-helix transcriptional regulator [Collinsella sp. BA40]TXF39047.1 helix-turn-helix transcriptional regulator [Collinsella sp. BA40]
MDYKKRIASGIRAERGRAHMSQADLADRCGLNVVSIANYEREASCPSLENAIRIAEALGCTVNDLVSPQAPAERGTVA